MFLFEGGWSGADEASAQEPGLRVNLQRGSWNILSFSEDK